MDWFHVVKLFSSHLQVFRRTERKQAHFPNSLRWAMLKSENKTKTNAQQKRSWNWRTAILQQQQPIDFHSRN